MFTEPIPITVNVTTSNLPRVQVGSVLNNTPSIYRTSDELLIFTINNQKTRANRHRHTARLDQRKVVTDPVNSTTDFDSISVSVVIDRPEYGWSATEVDYVVAALKTWLTTANVAKLFGGES